MIIPGFLKVTQCPVDSRYVHILKSINVLRNKWIEKIMIFKVVTQTVEC